MGAKHLSAEEDDLGLWLQGEEKTEEKHIEEKVEDTQYSALHSQVKGMCAALWPTRMPGREESIWLSVVHQLLSSSCKSSSWEKNLTLQKVLNKNQVGQDKGWTRLQRQIYLRGATGISDSG